MMELAIQQELESVVALAVAKASSQLSVTSQRIYRSDARAFGIWLSENGITDLRQVTQDVMEAYRNHLSLRANYAPATGKRMWTVARRVIGFQIDKGMVDERVLNGIAGIVADDASPHIALKLEQARELLAAVPRDSHRGKRDYAILLLLLHTGIRRSECASLEVGSLVAEQGHTVLWVLGKGNRREKIKVPVQVVRVISEYREDCGRADAAPGAPLFVHIRKGDHVTVDGIGEKSIERIVLQYAAAAGINDLTPHGLRATFITLALEGGARLEQVQYAARHKNPMTTERYQRRKINLDDNAVDYIRL